MTPIPLGPLRPLARVVLPVAVAAVLFCLAIINIALVKTWKGELEDGVLWRQEGANVVAAEIAPDRAGARAGLLPRDVVLTVDRREIRTPNDLVDIFHSADPGRPLTYVVTRAAHDAPVTLQLQPMPLVAKGLYYSLALVGLLSLVIGTSVRLRRPRDPATLHFFWLTVAFCGVLAFTPSGKYDRLDYFFEWSDLVARLLLPPLFLHFAFVFPERPNQWAKSDAARAVLLLLYLPAAILGFGRAWLLTAGASWSGTTHWLEIVEKLAYAYLAVCLTGGLFLMMRALRGLRSVTARRQLRWIVWGSVVGAVPFVSIYVVPLLTGTSVPYSQYTAVLLGCIPLAFASALVRYRLMDIEVIIKRGLLVAAVVVLLGLIYEGTLQLVGLILGPDAEGTNSWAWMATVIVAIVAPWLWNAIKAAIDRLYYRDRYDYRRALVNFARELNSDLDLDRLSNRLVERIRETLVIDRIALFLAANGESGRLVPAATAGFGAASAPGIEAASALGVRLLAGQTVVIDDVVPARRLGGDEAAAWRHAGLYSFLPCVSNDTTIGVIATGRRPQGDPLSSEDMALLGAVAAQAATALENARLYKQLSGKASEIERLRQFSDSVVESLSDGLFVVSLDDRVLRWNRQMEALTGRPRGEALGRQLSSLFSRPFADGLAAARRDSPGGIALHRVAFEIGPDDARRDRLANVAIAPFLTGDAGQAGWIVLMQDVTERAHLEEQLRLSEKMAAIGLLAAGVAHEVNTPLTGISSFTQLLLERSAPDDPKTHLLEKIEQQTFRAAKIVNNLLNLARPSGGEMQDVDLNQVITDVLSLLEHQFRIGRIQVGRHLVDAPVRVRGMEYKLQQVFLNLFLNARDAMPKGGWLTVATNVTDGEAVVEVADTGVGIPSEHLARIYDPFFTTKPEGRGTGLGLSVTYGIVSEHGGSLTCESDLNQGTRFRLALPALPAAVEAAGAGG